MMLRKLMSRTIAVAAAVILALNVPFSPFESRSVSANSTSLFSPLQEHKDEPGNYCYHFDGRLTNPCHENSIREKSNVIGSFWFEFTYVEDNGLGEQRTERLDMSYKDGRNFFITICTTVTKVAMITTKAGILTRLGITFFKSEIITLEHNNTKVTAAPIARPLIACVVTARVGQVPSTSPKVGLLLTMPLVRVFNRSFLMRPSSPTL